MFYFAHGDESEHAANSLSHQISNNIFLVAIVSLVIVGLLVAVGLWLSRTSTEKTSETTKPKAKSDE